MSPDRPVATASGTPDWGRHCSPLLKLLENTIPIISTIVDLGQETWALQFLTPQVVPLPANVPTIK